MPFLGDGTSWRRKAVAVAIHGLLFMGFQSFCPGPGVTWGQLAGIILREARNLCRTALDLPFASRVQIPPALQRTTGDLKSDDRFAKKAFIRTEAHGRRNPHSPSGPRIRRVVCSVCGL